MATLKHLSSKNADYGAAEQYLTFEHDEFSGKPILDENGRLVPRQDYRFATLNCDGEDFAVACMRANLRYGKNQRREDVKSHHYILSFDPRDGPDHGLTMDKAQELGEWFCAEQFPGHQALICTHPDGHNHSGNIHVHIVINSLRVKEVERKPYMDRASDTQAGAKHRCTAAAMRHFRAEVMELCQEAGLYQIDLLDGSKSRVTEREYWAQKKGQLALDTENAAQGKPPTKFETDKEKLRQEIRSVLAVAVSFEDFSQRLLQRGITAKESRGRLSYLTSDRTKPITARRLGDEFDRAAVGAALERNAARPSQGIKPSIREQLRQPQGVQRMVDIEAKKAQGKGVGYERWASVFNLKQAAQALNLYTCLLFPSPSPRAL
ncbi:MAG: relaxase/mobilization nuclease domain-containing protein, partial [Oscillospiraceae bacterium]|nr:relaxase/mobilization nuclease domain-containing protein [Oscillospiraceae bacterium]